MSWDEYARYVEQQIRDYEASQEGRLEIEEQRQAKEEWS